MKLSTLALLSIKNKKVDPSLGVSNVIDITEILFTLMIKLCSPFHKSAENLECKIEKMKF